MGQTSRVAKHFLVMLPIMFRRQVFFLLYNSPPFSFVAIYSRDGPNWWQDRVWFGVCVSRPILQLAGHKVSIQSLFKLQNYTQTFTCVWIITKKTINILINNVNFQNYLRINISTCTWHRFGFVAFISIFNRHALPNPPEYHILARYQMWLVDI